jgi:hypothetical protein
MTDWAFRTLAMAVMAALVATPAGGARAAPIEEPPSLSAEAVLGARARGSNYQVEDPVRSDGFLQVFTIRTAQGRHHVEGRDLLEVRLRELQALATLQQMSTSQTYLNAAAAAAKKPVDLAVGLVTNPVDTIERSMSGVGTLFSRIGAAASNPGRGRDSLADSALGIASAKRQLARQLGVDPYTDFKPLAAALDETARVTALGNLTVSGAFMAIPGGAGVAVSYSKTAEDMGQVVFDKTPSELRELNRGKLAALGVPAPLAGAFLDNTSFTPTDQTVIVAALARMTGVKNRQLFVTRVATASTRDLAFFFRRRAELIADQHTRVSPFADFSDIIGFPLNRTADGRVVAVLPLDQLAWTGPVSDLVASLDQTIKERRLGNAVEIRLSGTVTDAARQGLAEQGWTVVERLTTEPRARGTAPAKAAPGTAKPAPSSR